MTAACERLLELMFAADGEMLRNMNSRDLVALVRSPVDLAGIDTTRVVVERATRVADTFNSGHAAQFLHVLSRCQFALWEEQHG